MSVFFQFAGGHRQKIFFFFLNRFPGRKLPIELSSGRATCGRTLRQKPMTMLDNQGLHLESSKARFAPQRGWEGQANTQWCNNRRPAFGPCQGHLLSVWGLKLWLLHPIKPYWQVALEFLWIFLMRLTASAGSWFNWC